MNLYWLFQSWDCIDFTKEYGLPDTVYTGYVWDHVVVTDIDDSTLLISEAQVDNIQAGEFSK